jgi:hypothetical protein
MCSQVGFYFWLGWILWLAAVLIFFFFETGLGYFVCWLMGWQRWLEYLVGRVKKKEEKKKKTDVVKEE